MNRIKLLSEQVANQIAAGEVVERPASVVKELVENALDAGARCIEVEVQAGGRSLIRVTDDGHGMSRDDALLCLERHATSKITRAEDLSHVRTMGFRGEAVPSIASVSRFMLTTREADCPAGTQIIVQGGAIATVKDTGAAPGTAVEVRSLFYNLPARRKFLRTDETERAHVQHALLLAALAHPEVAFAFTHDGRLIWRLPAEKGVEMEALRRRLLALWGDGMTLLPLEGAKELQARAVGGQIVPAAPCRLWGLIGAPGVARSTREQEHVFVNRRPVDNRGLHHALVEGYHTMLMKGRYPVACLFLEIDPAEVDVNIHPAKREVKFHREREVRQLVTEAIRGVLTEYHAPVAPVVPTALATPVAGVLPISWGSADPFSQSVRPAISLEASPLPSPRQDLLPMGWRPAPPVAAAAVSAVTPPVRPVSVNGPTPLLAVPLRILGVIGRLYVVLESDRGLVLMDQHAAHERVLYEQMLDRLEKREAVVSQKLLLPEAIQMPPRDAQFVMDHLDTLNRLGVGLGEFGERTFLIDALPPFLKVADAKQFVLSLVDELKAVGQSVNSMRLGEGMVAKTVCRHAVKANDALAGPELERLLADLRGCRMPYTCPHGRPTLIEMSYGELEKRFGRAG